MLVRLKLKYPSCRIFSNVKTIPGGAELRIISRKQPAENAIQVDATLEDVFLYYFGERAGEDDDSV